MLQKIDFTAAPDQNRLKAAGSSGIYPQTYVKFHQIPLTSGLFKQSVSHNISRPDVSHPVSTVHLAAR